MGFDRTGEFQTLLSRPASSTNDNPRMKSPFYTDAVLVLALLNNFILSLDRSRKDYLDLSSKKTLSSADKDLLELNSKNFIEKSLGRINNLKHLDVSLSRNNDLATSHRNGIIWYLQKKLAGISETLRVMQQKRLERNLSHQESLLYSSTIDKFPHNSTSPLLRNRFHNSSKPYSNATYFGDEDDGNSELDLLTPDQISALETENAALLEKFESTLDQVHVATQSLAEIATLQTQLTNLLTDQQSIVDTIHDESIMATNSILSANSQLESAKRHMNDSRLFIIVFLFIASFILLFLDWYQ